MKHQYWLAIAAAAGLALTGCASMNSSSDTDASSGSSSGTMRRAESGSNTNPNPETRTSHCVPGDTRENCPRDHEASRTDSTDPAREPTSTEVEPPDAGAPEPR